MFIGEKSSRKVRKEISRINLKWVSGALGYDFKGGGWTWFLRSCSVMVLAVLNFGSSANTVTCKQRTVAFALCSS